MTVGRGVLFERSGQMDNALVVREDVSLEAYGKVEKVREMTRRLMAMLPSAKDLGTAGAGALAQASLAMGLNPFIGQIWAIPQGGRNKNGTYDTYGIMVGISGLRAKAHEQAKADGGMYSVHYRIPRGEEVEGLAINQGDIVRACDLVVSGRRARAHLEMTKEVPRYTGIGVYRKGERTKMNPLQVARKRAEAEAIKQAFDVPLSFVSGPGNVTDIEIEDEPERYTEHGEGLVNGASKKSADDALGDLGFDEWSGNAPPPIDYNGELIEGDEFLEGDYHGAPKDADAYDDLKAEETESAPDFSDWPPRMWPKLYFLARKDLGYNHDNHVKNTLEQLFGENWHKEQTYASVWPELVAHQASKETAPAT
jgi:hypothetical protein